MVEVRETDCHRGFGSLVLVGARTAGNVIDADIDDLELGDVD